MQVPRRLASRAACTAGNKSPISIEMIVITTSSSTSEKPARDGRVRQIWRTAGVGMNGSPLSTGRGVWAVRPNPGRISSSGALCTGRRQEGWTGAGGGVGIMSPASHPATVSATIRHCASENRVRKWISVPRWEGPAVAEGFFAPFSGRRCRRPAATGLGRRVRLTINLRLSPPSQPLLPPPSPRLSRLLLPPLFSPGRPRSPRPAQDTAWKALNRPGPRGSGPVF